MRATAETTMLVFKASRWDTEADSVIRALHAVPNNGESAPHQNARVANILYSSPQNAEFFAILYARLLCQQGDFLQAARIAKEFVLPHLTAVSAREQGDAAAKQLRAAKFSLWTAEILGFLAVFFSAAQAYIAYLSLPHH